jgi:hypothetical protein
MMQGGETTTEGTEDEDLGDDGACESWVGLGWVG